MSEYTLTLKIDNSILDNEGYLKDEDILTKMKTTYIRILMAVNLDIYFTLKILHNNRQSLNLNNMSLRIRKETILLFWRNVKDKQIALI